MKLLDIKEKIWLLDDENFNFPTLEQMGGDLVAIGGDFHPQRLLNAYENGLEIDFVVVKNNKIEKLIQVSKSLENDKTKKRELEVFGKTVDELNLIDVKSIIISEDKSSKFLYNEQEIEVKNILEWLNFD